MPLQAQTVMSLTCAQDTSGGEVNRDSDARTYGAHRMCQTGRPERSFRPSPTITKPARR